MTHDLDLQSRLVITADARSWQDPIGECAECQVILYPGDDYGGFCAWCALLQELGGES